MKDDYNYFRNQVLPVFETAYKKVVNNYSKTFVKTGFIKGNIGESEWIPFVKLSTLPNEKLSSVFYHLILINGSWNESKFLGIEFKTIGRPNINSIDINLEFKTKEENELFIDFCNWCIGISVTSDQLDNIFI